MRDESSILPIKGKTLKVVRDGRILLDIDEIELGTKAVTCILGHNGAGKSLLLKVLSGLVKPDHGDVHWNGKKISRKDYLRLGYMKQNAVLLRRSAMANLEFPLLASGWKKTDASLAAEKALTEAGLTHIAQTSARVLSGGERQRLSLARMLIVRPEIAVLDEPTASLDPDAAAEIEGRIKVLAENGIPVVLVTHNLNQAKRLASDIIFLDHGKILAQQSKIQFFKKPDCVEARNFILE